MIIVENLDKRVVVKRIQRKPKKKLQSTPKILYSVFKTIGKGKKFVKLSLTEFFLVRTFHRNNKQFLKYGFKSIKESPNGLSISYQTNKKLGNKKFLVFC